MAVPKKRTSISKKRIRKNIWKKKRVLDNVESFFISKISFYREFKKLFCATNQINKKNKHSTNLNPFK